MSKIISEQFNLSIIAILIQNSHMTQSTLISQTRTPRFKIYSSSAGSGKTYTLAKEYLKLALKTSSQWYFTHILAVTFTNKAAEEMKERILKYLRQFSAEDPKDLEDSSGIFRQILEELQSEGIVIDEKELRARASRTFKHIIHEYANFSVSTIDSFVQRIVSAFTEELGFPFNFEVSLDSEVLMEAAVQKMMEKANSETFEHITEAIKSYALEKANEGKSWNNLPQELAGFGKNLLSDQNQEAIEKLTELTAEDFLVIERQLKQFCSYAEEKIQLTAKLFIETFESEDLLVEDFPYGQSGVAGHFLKIANGDFFKEAGTRVTKALETGEWYSKTKPAPVKAKIDGISEMLGIYGQMILDLQNEHKPKYFLYKELLKNIKKLSLLSQLKAEIRSIQDETGAIHISEFNRKILEIVLNEPVPFIYERLGDKYNHILIDEFQDTSILQWHNFLPLIENSLAGGHFNLAVGDAKQSIYRFRGGEMELIVKLHQKQIDSLLADFQENDFLAERYINILPYLTPENLNTNYRSTKEVIEFNNALFRKIKEDEANVNLAPSLPSVYDDHFEQKVPEKPKSGGHVQIDFLTKMPEISDDEQMFNRIVELINEALSAGYSYKDIAILSRKNKDSRNIANLLKEMGINVISSDSLSLSTSEAVSLVVALMKIIQNPDNRLAKYEAVYLFYRVVLHKIPSTKDNEEIKQAVENEDVLPFYDYLNHKGYGFDSFVLQQLSLYQIAERLIGVFGLFNHPKELDFLFRFLDVVLEFQTGKSTHLTDFLTFWEQKKISLSISTPKGQDAVTVTSIHKSKGLEFPVVIVPNCNWTTDTELSTAIWAELPRDGYPELEMAESEKEKFLATASVSVNSKLEQTCLHEQYHTEKEKTFLESLNMLYVALTRPTQRLYLIVRKSVSNSSFEKTVGNLLYKFIDSPVIEEGACYTEIINQGLDKNQQKNEEEMVESIEIKHITSSGKSNEVKLRHSAERLFDLKTLEKSKDYGNKVHAAFAKIRTIAEVDFALGEILREGLIIDSEIVSLKENILRIIGLEGIKPLFDVDATQVRNEREILMPEGQMLRPDRVVRFGRKIVILDYKTGSKSEKHKVQVEQYMNIYKEMGYDEVEGILVYLENLEVVQVTVNN